MPEIGYWKYVRFTDDEPLWFGTDDDITIVFDSADDRLEYKMKKDIRYEDDAGNEILTIQKATRTLSGFKMTGDLEIEKESPRLVLDITAGEHGGIRVEDAGVNIGTFRNNRLTGDWEFVDGIGVTRFSIDVSTGAITKVGDIDMGGNLLKNPKLGSNLMTAGYDMLHGVSDTGFLRMWGGSTAAYLSGASFVLFGTGYSGAEGQVNFSTGKVASANAKIRMLTYTTGLALTDRLIINYGDIPDIELQNCILNFSTGYPALETGKTATGEYLKIEVEGVTKFLALYA